MTLSDRARGLIDAATGARRARSPRAERVLLAVAALLFVAITAVSWANLPELDRAPTWWLLAPAAALAVCSVALNGGEVWLGARLHGVRVGPRAAFAASALSSAANLMPVPGAALVKIRTLRQHGLATGVAVRATAGLGVIWVGIGVGLAGALQAGDRPVAGALAAAAGLAVTVTGLAALGSTSTRRRVEAVALEVGSVVSTIARLLLVLAALGAPVSISDAAALTAASIVASAAGLFPGGLGLRELLSGLAAGIVGLDPAIGVLVSAVDRLVLLAVLAAISGLLVVTGEEAAADELAGDELAGDELAGDELTGEDRPPTEEGTCAS